MATRWRCPPDNARGLRSNSRSGAGCGPAPSTAARRSPLAIPAISSPNSMFSRTVMWGVKRVGLEHHRHAPLCGARGPSHPARRSGHGPRLGSSSPAIIRRRVDLPQPEGPTSTQNSPAAIDRSSAGITRSCEGFAQAFQPHFRHPVPLFHRALGQARDEPFPDDRKDRHDGRIARLAPARRQAPVHLILPDDPANPTGTVRSASDRIMTEAKTYFRPTRSRRQRRQTAAMPARSGAEGCAEGS